MGRMDVNIWGWARNGFADAEAGGWMAEKACFQGGGGFHMAWVAATGAERTVGRRALQRAAKVI